MPQVKDLIVKAPKILIYGAPGTGKTALALTLGEYCYYLDADDGLITGLKFNDNFTVRRHAVEFVDCVDHEPTKARGFKRICDVVQDIERQIHAKTFKYKAIVLDSLTAVCEASMRATLYPQVDKKPTLPDWGDAIRNVELLLNRLRSLPIVVVFLAHEMTEQVDQLSQVRLSAIGQKLPPKIPAYFDEFWYSKISGQKYVLQTRGTSSIPARSRRSVPNMIEQNLGMVEILKQSGYEFN